MIEFGLTTPRLDVDIESPPPIEVGFEGVTIEATQDHDRLFNRDISDQHPISAITGLTEAIEQTGKNLSDEYSNQQTYSLGQFCARIGKVYKCIIPITTPMAWNSSYWEEVGIADEMFEHISDTDIHVTAEERTYWNEKLNEAEADGETLVIF